MSNLNQQFCQHVHAGSPAIYLVSTEEERVDAFIRELAPALSMTRVQEWNMGHGWVKFDTKRPLASDLRSARTDLETCLLELLDDDELDGCLIVVKDANQALEQNTLAAARLKQLLNRIERHHSGQCAVLLVGASFTIPSSLESQVTLLNLPLPDRSTIRQLLSEILIENEASVPDHLSAAIVSGLSGLTAREVRQVLRMAVRPGESITQSDFTMILSEKKQIIAKSGVLEMVDANVRATDIGGLHRLKEWLQQRGQVLQRLDQALASGVTPPKGVLIAGMPGCGKSLTAKVAADLFQMPLLRLDIGSLLGKYVGESEHNMRRALSMAETVSPCILWVDELEKAFVGMGNSGSEVSSRLLGYFLTWMQEKSGAVFVIATANDITALPPELLRKGRFDEIFYVGFPSGEERKSILEIHLAKAKQTSEGLDLDVLVDACRDYCGADIENAVGEAVTTAFIDNKALDQQLLLNAIQSTVSLRETLREQVGRYEELFEKLKLRPASNQGGMSVAQMIRMADDPNQLKREDVAKSRDCPTDLLEKLVTDPQIAVQKAVYANPRCPERLLSIRINIRPGAPDFNSELLQLACENQNAPLDLLSHHLKDRSFEAGIRFAIANSAHALGLAEYLIADDDVKVRAALAGCIGLPEAHQLKLSYEYANQVGEALAANPGLCSAAMENLFPRLRHNQKIKLAKCTGLSHDTMMALAEDDNQLVRKSVAGNSDLPESLQMTLAEDEDDGVLDALFNNPQLTEKARSLLLESNHGQVGTFLEMACVIDGNAILKGLAEKSVEFKKDLASRPGLPDYLQVALASDENLNVRLAMARNAELCKVARDVLEKSDSTLIKQALGLPTTGLWGSHFSNIAKMMSETAAIATRARAGEAVKWLDENSKK